MAKKAKQTVIVFENKWKDRHGEEGSDVQVFGTMASACDHLASSIESYLKQYGVVDGDNVDLGRIASIEAEDLVRDDEDTRPLTLFKLKQAAVMGGWLEIDVDAEGTSSSWSVGIQEVL